MTSTMHVSPSQPRELSGTLASSFRHAQCMLLLTTRYRCVYSVSGFAVIPLCEHAAGCSLLCPPLGADQLHAEGSLIKFVMFVVAAAVWQFIVACLRLHARGKPIEVCNYISSNLYRGCNYISSNLLFSSPWHMHVEAAACVLCTAGAIADMVTASVLSCLAVLMQAA